MQTEMKPLTRPDKLPGLESFIGTEQYWNHRMVGDHTIYNYTDGVHHVAEKGNAYWLLDVIFSHVADIYSSREIPTDQKRLLVCRLLRNDAGDGALFTVDDGNYNRLAHQEIEFTDFPAREQIIWVQNGVAMLPSEY